MANLETLGSAFKDTLITESNREYMDDKNAYISSLLQLS